MKDASGGIQGGGSGPKPYFDVKVGNRLMKVDDTAEMHVAMDQIDSNDDNRISVSEASAHPTQDGFKGSIKAGLTPKDGVTSPKFSQLLDTYATRIGDEMARTGEKQTFSNLMGLAADGDVFHGNGSGQDVAVKGMGFGEFRQFVQDKVDTSGLAADDKAAIMAQVERTIAKKTDEGHKGLTVQISSFPQISIAPKPKPPAPPAK